MSKQIHTIYITLLFTLGVGTALVVGFNGFTYYSTDQEKISNLKADLDAKISGIDVGIELIKLNPVQMGKTEADLLREKAALKSKATYWDDWKPAGLYGHGLGIIGSAMMIVGVTTYSSRKRIKKLRYVGKIKYWLEFHIFLCLLGPTLVLYHTTFKFGGIVSVSAWSMIFVALSGLIGRYIYTQIPMTIEGNERSVDDLSEENEKLRIELQNTYTIDARTIDMINHISHIETAETHPSVFKALISLVKDDFSRRSRMHGVKDNLRSIQIPARNISTIMSIAKQKSLLLRRIAFLDTARAIFHYWHVVHLPFSIIMFLILAIHVFVTVSLGYTWIF